MVDFIDKTNEQNGTPINRRNLMALQGFQSVVTSFNDDGSITQTNEDGHTLTTTFYDDGTIGVEFVGEETILKVISFGANGNISEVIS